MDSKFYVSYETQELLIEKGYPIEKDTPIYNKQGDVIGCYPADRPTKSEAIDWLDSKGIVVEITLLKRGKWRWTIYTQSELIDSLREFYEDYKNRLEAEEAAIIKALKSL